MPTDREIEAKAREMYLSRYASIGGRWELVETKDVWRDKAREWFRLDEGTRMARPRIVRIGPMTTHDANGRPYAKLSELKVGDVIELDDGFTCAPSGRKVLKTSPEGLAFDCDEGEAAHVIDGQADDGEHCIGIYKIEV